MHRKSVGWRLSSNRCLAGDFSRNLKCVDVRSVRKADPTLQPPNNECSTGTRQSVRTFATLMDSTGLPKLEPTMCPLADGSWAPYPPLNYRPAYFPPPLWFGVEAPQDTPMARVSGQVQAVEEKVAALESTLVCESGNSLLTQMNEQLQVFQNKLVALESKITCKSGNNLQKRVAALETAAGAKGGTPLIDRIVALETAAKPDQTTLDTIYEQFAAKSEMFQTAQDSWESRHADLCAKLGTVTEACVATNKTSTEDAVLRAVNRQLEAFDDKFAEAVDAATLRLEAYLRKETAKRTQATEKRLCAVETTLKRDLQWLLRPKTQYGSVRGELDAIGQDVLRLTELHTTMKRDGLKLVEQTSQSCKKLEAMVQTLKDTTCAQNAKVTQEFLDHKHTFEAMVTMHENKCVETKSAFQEAVERNTSACRALQAFFLDKLDAIENDKWLLLQALDTSD